MYKDNFEIIILRKWEICSFDLWEILSSIFFVVKHVEKEEEDKKWRSIQLRESFRRRNWTLIKSILYFI